MCKICLTTDSTTDETPNRVLNHGEARAKLSFPFPPLQDRQRFSRVIHCSAWDCLSTVPGLAWNVRRRQMEEPLRQSETKLPGFDLADGHELVIFKPRATKESTYRMHSHWRRDHQLPSNSSRYTFQDLTYFSIHPSMTTLARIPRDWMLSHKPNLQIITAPRSCQR